MKIRNKEDLKKIVDMIYYTKDKYGIGLNLIAYKAGDFVSVSIIENDAEFFIEDYRDQLKTFDKPSCIFDMNYVYKYNFILKEDIRRIQNKACTCPYAEDEEECKCHCNIPSDEEAKKILYDDIIETILIPNIKKAIK